MRRLTALAVALLAALVIAPVAGATNPLTAFTLVVPKSTAASGLQARAILPTGARCPALSVTTEVDGVRSDRLIAMTARRPSPRSALIDKEEFRVGYKEIAPDASSAMFDAKWATVSKGGEHVTLDALAAHWGIKLGTDDVATDGMSDEQIVEVMALHGLMLTMAEERKKREEANTRGALLSRHLRPKSSGTPSRMATAHGVRR